MNEYIVIDRKPTAEELNSFRQTVGWGYRDPIATQRGLENTLYGACAFCGSGIVGTVRVVGDGSTVFYIQDVIVTPEHQGQGVGRLLLQHAMDYIAANACGGAVVGLMAAKGKEPFYEKFGFHVRPNGNEGAGMIQFWKK